jgi:hypothetical protein|tara:strand:+ start:233 stop:559 length:327 start_codon:yes stop_codon:yes gene_type:complete
MRIFNKVEFREFVLDNDELYLCGGFEEDRNEYDEIINEVVVEDGVYCLHFGSRGEVDFMKVDFVEEMIEFNNLEKDEFEYIRDDVEGYMDVCFGEESIKNYFIIKGSV